MLRTALSGLLQQIGALSQQVANYDQQIGALAERHPEVKRLAGIPGVGRLTATTFILTLGRAERFAHSRDVAGFLGLRPQATAERCARSAVGNFQEWQSVSAQAAGALRASRSGTLG
jgi:transposase